VPLVVPYDPEWALRFEVESAMLERVLARWLGGGIHHVAIYIGGGDVIQAPQSGDIVRVTPLDQVDSGYFGATRPLT
jgi:GrpB-like predicted nucleotidyltransferase (UPF0157 family)